MRELPKGWAEAPVSFAAEVNPPRALLPIPKDGQVSFVRMASVEAESGILDASQLRAWDEVSKGYTKFQEDDVLFAKITPCMENGKIAIAKELRGHVGAGSTEFHVLRPGAAIRPKYLLHFLLQRDVRQNARMVMQGAAGQLRVPASFFDRVSLPLAPPREQDRIVAEIEKQFTRLDAATAALKRVQDNLKRYRASVLKAACEGRLVSTEAELARQEGRGYEPADKLLQRLLRERRARWEADTLAKMQASGKPPKDNHWKQKYKGPVAPDTANLPQLAEGWCWVSLGQVVWSVKDGPHYSPKYVESGIPFITGGQVRPSGVDFTTAKFISPELHEELSRRCHPSKGDVLLTKGGTTGIARVNTYDIDFSVWVHVAVLKPVDSIEPFYLQHALNSPFCYAQSMRYTHGVGNQDLGLTRMVNIVLALPPLAEQGRINGELDRQFATIDRLEASLDAGTAHWRRLRQSVLSSAFAGQLVPQDPSDEPASTLLERIRSERANQSRHTTARNTKQKSKTARQRGAK
jgi:type I restriction enzyme S subunit